jgi:hypothetical protein
MFALWITAFAPHPGWATEVAGVRLFDTPPAAAPTGPTTATLIESWNDGQPYQPVGVYAACFGFAYVPAQTYVLERVEFYAGGLAGPVSVSIHQDIGSGWPTGPTLSSVAYAESATLGWQGADLVPPLLVLAGTTYYIYYSPVQGAPTSTCSAGTPIPHSWAYDCATWEGPQLVFIWLARFHGTPLPTRTSAVTWSAIKRLYR